MARRPPEPVTALWLSHHWPEDYDRCTVVAGRNVCRRCGTLYPLALVVMALALAGWWWPPGWDPVALVVLPLPTVVDWVAEHLGLVRYSPRRQVAVTVPLGLALGAGFARYLEDPGDPWFWAVVVGYGGLCAAVALWANRRRPAGAGSADGTGSADGNDG